MPGPRDFQVTVGTCSTSGGLSFDFGPFTGPGIVLAASDIVKADRRAS